MCLKIDGKTSTCTLCGQIKKFNSAISHEVSGGSYITVVE